MIVGLTGGIGSGKSTVARLFGELGIPVYEADRMAKHLMQSSKKIRHAVVQLIGKEAYNDERLNRSFIAKKVFNDSDLLEKLNDIVHPAVKRHFLKWTKKQDAPYVIQENAIIFESGSKDFYDKIILVTAPIEVRITRILARDNTSKANILARMNNQWSDTEKIPLADYVIENIDLDKTRAIIEEVHLLMLQYS